MTLSASFANALSGLRLSGRLTEVASSNLANALTDGYGRQVARIGSVSLNGAGAGARVTTVTRAFAPEYTPIRRQADGEAAESAEIAEALARIGLALGEATDPDGLFRRLESFEAALRQFAETPESGPRQLATIETARDLAVFLNKLSGDAAIIRQDADTAIADQVARVNRNLADIDRLNRQIQRLSITQVSTATLVDQRERLIDEVAAIIPVHVQPRDHDVVHLYTAEGVFLLQDSVSPLSFTPSPIITAPMIYDPAGGGALSGLTLRGLDIAPGSGASQTLRSGSLAGLFAVRDGFGTDFHARIDQFAADLISRFQDPAVDPTLAAGDPGLFTDNGAALDPLAVEGLAGRVALNALADPAQGGAPTVLRDGLQAAGPGPVTSDVIARNLLDALTARRPAGAIPGLTGNRTAAQMISGIVELTGIERTGAESEAARLRGTRQTLAEGEAARIGVNTDEELQSLLVIEQAFNANVQIIQTASRMLQELMELR